MKQSNLVLVIILMVLLTLIAATSIALFVVVSDTASVAQTSGSTTGDDRPSVTPRPQTTPPTTLTMTPGATTTAPPPITDPSPVVTTTTAAPVVTTAPVPETNDPSGIPSAPLSGTIQGDKLGGMNVDAVYEVVENNGASATAKVRFAVYVNSYAIGIGARSENYLTVNGNTAEAIYTPAVKVPAGSGLTRTLLYETVLEISKTNDGTIPFQVEFGWFYAGSYSGEYADWITVSANLNITP